MKELGWSKEASMFFCYRIVKDCPNHNFSNIMSMKMTLTKNIIQKLDRSCGIFRRMRTEERTIRGEQKSFRMNQLDCPI